jgi:hypothetical protein
VVNKYRAGIYDSSGNKAANAESNPELAVSGEAEVLDSSTVKHFSGREIRRLGKGLKP